MHLPGNDTVGVSSSSIEKMYVALIKGGVHDGAKIALSDGVHRVGREPDAEVCLQDDALEEPKSLVLIRGRAGILGAEDDQDSLALQKLPCELQFGDTILTVSEQCGKRASVSWIGLTAGAFIIASALGVVGILFSIGAQTGASSSTTQQADLTLSGASSDDGLWMMELSENPSDEAEEEALLAEVSPTDEFVERGSGHVVDDTAVDPIELLSDKLATFEGGENLKIEAMDGMIHVHGEINQIYAKDLDAIQAWHDEHHGSTVLVHWNVEFAEQSDAPPLNIESIWFGDRPHIIANGGQEYFEGTNLPAGWTIGRIEADHVILRRYGEKDLIIEIDSILDKQKAKAS